MNNLKKQIKDSEVSKYSLLNIEKKINKSILEIFSKIKKKGKIMLCGNGGSAADAQHLAAEFLIRLRPKINREPIPAITLAQDTSTITACGNDYNFDMQYSRTLEALGKKNDILIAISTSGNSKNIINVLKQAKKMKIFSIGFLGSKGGKAKKLCNIPLIVDSDNTARIQEAHIFLGHYILREVEENLLKNKIIKKT
jgi:D-sedoheptulose 7-phosphate isomerase